MARKVKSEKLHLLQDKLQETVRSIDLRLSVDFLREDVLRLVPVRHIVKQMGVSLIPDIPSGIDRIIYYLRKYPMTLIDGAELAVVAGIEDYPRRIRQLRREKGWNIISGTVAEMQKQEDPEIFQHLNFSKIKADQYILLNTEPDREAAYRWDVANSIRRKKVGDKDVSGKQKILEYFKMNVGKAVVSEELRYVSNNASEWARRVRELRSEDAWPIETLPNGTYILQENRQGLPHDRNIKAGVYSAVLDRDRHQCQKCGWSKENAQSHDPRKRLELHHIEHHKHGGKNEKDNLITLCNVHHDEVHSIGESWTPDELFQWLGR